MQTFLQSLPGSVARLSLWLAVLVVVFAPLERLFAVHPKKLLRRGIGVDLGYYFLSSLVPALILSVPAGLLAWAARQAVPQVVLDAVGALPMGAKVLASLVAGELGYYWGHRWSHEVPYLWRFHAVHHSAEEIDFLVNTRAHPLDMVFSRFCGLVPIYALGLAGPSEPSGSLAVVLATLIGTVWGFFIHSNLKWRFGPLEWLISTPAFHHWHHTRTPVNRNYASTLPILDWIFGTHYLPDAFPESYGIKARLPESLLGQLAYPFQADEDGGPAQHEPAAERAFDGPRPQRAADHATAS